MKKGLKKIGLFSLIVAMLTSFVSLTNVKAAESCENHLQNYIFLDMTSLGVGKNSLTGENETALNKYAAGYNPSSYLTNIGEGYITETNFKYTFPENKDIKIKSVQVDNFNYPTEDSLYSYWQFYRDFLNSPSMEIVKSEFEGKVFITDTATSLINQGYTTNSLLFHGVWNRETNKYDYFAANSTLKNNILAVIGEGQTRNMSAYTLQRKLYNSTISKYMNIEFYLSDNVPLNADNLQKLVDGELNLIKPDANNQNNIPVKVKRTIGLSDEALEKALNANYTFGNCTDDNNDGNDDYCGIYGEYSDTIGSVQSSYTGVLKGGQFNKNYTDESGVVKTHTRETLINGVKNATTGEWISKPVDFFIGTKGVNYYWPAVLTVEYQACTTTSETWTLQYDGNDEGTNTAVNLPNSESANVGTSIKVSSQVPTREGYTFKTWCTDKLGKETCYGAGSEVKSDVSTTITLYAQWGKTDTEDNSKTGIVSYALGILAVGAVAGGIYYISKKKDLFKQI